MISRSDGKTFHLLLAHRHLPYSLKRAAGPTNWISVFFAKGVPVETELVSLRNLSSP
jgi:hypothetical protein